MAETRATASIWDIRAEDIALKRHDTIPAVLYLELGPLVHLEIGGGGDDALEAAAMRKLARVATEAAEDLERRAEERRDGSDG